MIEQFMVLNIHPAQGKGPCNVEINDGRKIAAWNNEHTQLQIGSSYSADIYSKVNGNYTNWAFSKTPNITPAGGVQQPAQQTATEARTAPPKDADRERNRSIITQSFCNKAFDAQGNYHGDQAETALRHYFQIMAGGGWARIYKEAQGGFETQQAPPPPPPPSEDELSDEIPF